MRFWRILDPPAFAVALALKGQGWQQYRIAKALGITQQSLSRAMTGKPGPWRGEGRPKTRLMCQRRRTVDMVNAVNVLASTGHDRRVVSAVIGLTAPVPCERIMSGDDVAMDAAKALDRLDWQQCRIAQALGVSQQSMSRHLAIALEA